MCLLRSLAHGGLKSRVFKSCLVRFLAHGGFKGSVFKSSVLLGIWLTVDSLVVSFCLLSG